MMLAGRDGMGDGGWGRVPRAGACCRRCLPGGAHPSYGARSSQVRLTTYGRNPRGSAGCRSGENETQWADLPSLADFQSMGRLRPGAVVLLEAQSAQIAPIRCW